MNEPEDYPRKITLRDWDFRHIKLRDKAMFEDYMKQCEFPVNLWSANFAYLWADSREDGKKVVWKIVDDMLVPFVILRKMGLHVICMPMGPGGSDRLLQVISRCLKFCNRWNKDNGYAPGTLRTINEAQLAFLGRSSRFRKDFEYVQIRGIERHFSITKVTELAGKDFERVRSYVNRFRREYPQTVIRRYHPQDYDKLFKVNENWKQTAGKNYSVIFDTVYFREIVKHHEELDHLILVVEMDGRIVGMVSGGMTADGQSWGCLIKKMANVRGINETMIVEFAKEIQRLNPSVELMNVGSDLGVEGLISFKEKFRPVLNLERYRVQLRNV